MLFTYVSLMAAMVVAFFAGPQGVSESMANQPSAASGKIMLASTIGPIDAGIVGNLEEEFTKRTGIAVERGDGRGDKDARNGQF